jgi:DNA-binding SARP family transcriptional activator
VFAALVADAGRLVPVDTIIDRVWGAEPPRRARATLHTHLTRLRRLLEQAGIPARLACRAGGYTIEIGPDAVDVHRFHRLARQARDPGRGDAERARLLSEALGLWRGEPLTGLRGEWAEQVRSIWLRRHLDAVLAWAQLEEPGAVIGPLTELAERYPMDESVAAALMRALAATGRPAETLDAYRRIRRQLVEELGVEPGPELRDLHQAVLRGTTPARRSFYVQRVIDARASRVADGVVWPDGSASLRWDRFEDAVAAGMRIIWLD